MENIELTVVRVFKDKPYLFAAMYDGESVYCHRLSFIDHKKFDEAKEGDTLSGLVYKKNSELYAATRIH